MSGPPVSLNPIPTGGAVRLDLYRGADGAYAPPSGVVACTISRAASGAAYVQIYSGAPLPVWLDTGDSLPGPLASGTAYYWRVADDTGTTQVGPVVPASAVDYVPDQLTQLFVRLMQCGVNCLDPVPVTPQGRDPKLPTVTTRMPQNGLGALPFVVVNPELIEQSETGIGQDVPNPDQDNRWTIVVNATRAWRISLFCFTPTERDFYRDAILAMFQVWHQAVFTQIGLNVSHRFIAHSGTDASEGEMRAPGFFDADILLTVDGTFPVAVLTALNYIEEIDASVTLEPNGTAFTATVPTP